jgi:hypothetical protein
MNDKQPATIAAVVAAPAPAAAAPPVAMDVVVSGAAIGAPFPSFGR